MLLHLNCMVLRYYLYHFKLSFRSSTCASHGYVGACSTRNPKPQYVSWTGSSTPYQKTLSVARDTTGSTDTTRSGHLCTSRSTSLVQVSVVLRKTRQMVYSFVEPRHVSIWGGLHHLRWFVPNNPNVSSRRYVDLSIWLGPSNSNGLIGEFYT